MTVIEGKAKNRSSRLIFKPFSYTERLYKPNGNNDGHDGLVLSN